MDSVRFRMNEEIGNSILDFHKNGLNSIAIASKVGCSSKTVLDFLKIKGLTRTNKKHSFSEEPKKNIIDLYTNKKYTVNEISRLYDSCKKAVRNLLIRNGIEIDTERTTKIKTREEKLKIVDLYKSGKNSYRIAEIFNCSYQTIVNVLKEYNIDRRNSYDRNKKYSVDSNFFDKIDSHIKAQILGFIGADGCIFKNALIINISERDVDYLEFIKKELNYNGNIGKVIPKNKGKIKTKLPMRNLYITDKNSVENLKRMGFVSAKSNILQFPSRESVPIEFVNSFILGYLEGDGSIIVSSKTKRGSIQICGTFNFLTGIKSIIKQILDIESSIIRDNPKTYNRNFPESNMRLSIAGNQQVLKFLNWIYKDIQFKMERKYNKFIELKSLYSNNLIKYRPIKSNNYEEYL